MSKHWISRLAELLAKKKAGKQQLSSREGRQLRKLTAQMAARTGRIADAQAWRSTGHQKRSAAKAGKIRRINEAAAAEYVKDHPLLKATPGVIISRPKP